MNSYNHFISYDWTATLAWKSTYPITNSELVGLDGCNSPFLCESVLKKLHLIAVFIKWLEVGVRDGKSEDLKEFLIVLVHQASFTWNSQQKVRVVSYWFLELEESKVILKFINIFAILKLLRVFPRLHLVIFLGNTIGSQVKLEPAIFCLIHLIIDVMC